MAGIYIHIPFCHSKCAYCDFYKTTELLQKPQLISAIKLELNNRKDFLKDEKIETIYFGGGTPSVLNFSEIESILKEIESLHRVEKNAEITFEANPDDLSLNYLEELNKTGVNRLSVGIQSFFDNDLLKMGRRHNSRQAVKCIEDAYKTGFKDISIDLIYGLPKLNINHWEENLKKAFSLPINHLSAYHLTYHKGTKFFNLKKQGIIKEITEEASVKQFELLLDMSAANGFDNYEISNFAKNGRISRHNSGYWFEKKYLGIGPSSHSFDGNSRLWNTANLKKYLLQLSKGEKYFEMELLSDNDKYNDYIITRLRTKWGFSEELILSKFGNINLLRIKKIIQPFILSGHVISNNGIFTLSRKGFFISDKIMEALIKIGD